jgi:hypothetical protein
VSDRANGATLSADRKYRYRLWRSLGRGAGAVTFIMLNPSTADETEDDPTIRRCLAFAKMWGHKSLDVVNLFAFRATNPKELAKAEDPIGPENDRVIERVITDASLVIAAWGVHGALNGRDDDVIRMVQPTGKLHYLRFTKAKHPSHPLYLPGTLKPIQWGSSGGTNGR